MSEIDKGKKRGGRGGRREEKQKKKRGREEGEEEKESKGLLFFPDAGVCSKILNSSKTQIMSN